MFFARLFLLRQLSLYSLFILSLFSVFALESWLVLNLNAYYNIAMSAEEKKTIAYIVACISEFARSTGLNTQEAFRYLSNHGGIDFLIEFYDVEHTLSLNEAVDDLKAVAQRAGGLIA